MSSSEDTVRFHRPVMDIPSTVNALAEKMRKGTGNADHYQEILEAAIRGATDQVQADMLESFARILKVTPVYQTDGQKPHQP